MREVIKTHYSNGNPRDEIQKLNGVGHGYQKHWYENGNMCYCCFRYNGIRQRLFFIWNENGYRSTVSCQKNENHHGPGINFQY